MPGDLPELFTTEEWRELAKALHLTRRQRQVARRLCLGLKNREMAEEMSVAEDTIRLHMRELYRKLGVGQRVGVVVKLVLAHRQSTQRRTYTNG